MNRLNKIYYETARITRVRIYKSVFLEHFLLTKRVLVLILLLEVILFGWEIIAGDPQGEGTKVQQKLSSEVLGAQEQGKVQPGAEPEKLQPGATPGTKTSPLPGRTDVSSPTENSTENLQNQTSSIATTKDPNYTDGGYLRYNLQPYLKEISTSNVNIQKGTIKFAITPDWGENLEDKFKTLVLANFNGEDYRNVFSIVGSQQEINFDTFDDNGVSGEDNPNADLGTGYYGKTFEIKLRWDFTLGIPVKQIFINGQLAQEVNPAVVPSAKNAKILIGPVQNLEIFDQWID